MADDGGSREFAAFTAVSAVPSAGEMNASSTGSDRARMTTSGAALYTTMTSKGWVRWYGVRLPDPASDLACGVCGVCIDCDPVDVAPVAVACRCAGGQR